MVAADFSREDFTSATLGATAACAPPHRCLLLDRQVASVLPFHLLPFPLPTDALSTQPTPCPAKYSPILPTDVLSSAEYHTIHQTDARFHERDAGRDFGVCTPPSLPPPRPSGSSRVYGAGCGLEIGCLGFRACGLGCRFQGSGCVVNGVGFRVQGVRFRV